MASILIVGAVMALASCGSGGKAPRFAFPTGPFTKADLSGAYAFSMSGSNGFGFFTAAGTLQADGNGNITSSLFDFNSGGNGVFPNTAATGFYAVAPDGRVNLRLNSEVAILALDAVLITPARGLLVRFDTNATASGTLDRQDAGAFSTAALHGPFVFNLAGVDATGAITQSAGILSADGAGLITEGVQDQNKNGTISANLPLHGTYTVGADGRGTLELITATSVLNFAFYVVDDTHLKLVELDTALALGGEAFRQEGTFSNASLHGPYVFTVSGMSTVGPYAAGGIFTADGNGNISTGVEDENDAGNVNQNGSITGQYAMAANGRGTLALNTPTGAANFAVYPSNGGLQMIEMDSTIVSGGAAFVGAIEANPVAALAGSFGYNLTGSNNAGPMDSIAQFTSDGVGKVTGAVDYNMSGALNFGLKLDGTYTVAANGRGNLVLRSTTANQNLAIYVAATRVLFIELDRSTVATGLFERQ